MVKKSKTNHIDEKEAEAILREILIARRKTPGKIGTMIGSIVGWSLIISLVLIFLAIVKWAVGVLF